MFTLNRIELIGHVGNAPELRFTGTCKPVAQMSLATNERWKDAAGGLKERTEWHRIICWGPLGETVTKHLRKGAFVRVVGRLQTREFENKDGAKVRVTEVIAADVGFLERKRDTDQPPAAADAPADGPAPDEPLPF